MSAPRDVSVQCKALRWVGSLREQPVLCCPKRSFELKVHTRAHTHICKHICVNLALRHCRHHDGSIGKKHLFSSIDPTQLQRPKEGSQNPMTGASVVPGLAPGRISRQHLSSQHLSSQSLALIYRLRHVCVCVYTRARKSDQAHRRGTPSRRAQPNASMYDGGGTPRGAGGANRQDDVERSGGRFHPENREWERESLRPSRRSIDRTSSWFP